MTNSLEVIGIIIIVLFSLPCEYLRIKGWEITNKSKDGAHTLYAKLTLYKYMLNEDIPLEVKYPFLAFATMCLFGTLIAALGFFLGGKILIPTLLFTSFILGGIWLLKFKSTMK